ncbi:MAG: hypothetical protein EPO20_15230 [Betaproteobacteria bacterium]|nr:MAG: hypothetical protein EPO20_15230 [Betaproteobacteria bacterium]
MSRLLVLILLVVAAVWLVRRALRGAAPQERRGQKPASADELVACAHCGVHLPRAEARVSAGGLYCSEEHARLGKR